MRALLIVVIALVLSAGCKSTRKTSTQLYTSNDSTSYTEVTTVDIDTTVIAADTADLTILFAADPGGVTVEEVRTDQGQTVTINYEVVNTPRGAAVKVRAVTKPQEIITTNTTTEITRAEVSKEQAVSVEEKKVKRGFSLWHLAWLLPIVLIVFVVRKFWPVIRTYFGL